MRLCHFIFVFVCVDIRLIYAWNRGFRGVGSCMIVNIHHVCLVSTNVGFLRLDGICLNSRGYNWVYWFL